MGRGRTPDARSRGAICGIVLGVALTLLGAWPASAPAGPMTHPPQSALHEFRLICAELADARERLADGRIDEEAFADTLLALFTRADSLAHLLASGPRGNPSWITFQRSNAYLIDSLRDNWVGMTARNGVSFAEADLALKAAVAWRSNVTEAAQAP